MEIHLKYILGRVLAAIMTACLLFSVPGFALAAGRSRNHSSTAKTKDEIGALSAELNRIVSEYETADNRLHRINRNLVKAQRQLEETRKELDKNQAVLNARMNSIYRHGNVNFAEVLLGTKDFQEFVARMDLLKRIGEQDTQVLNEVKRKKAEIEKKNNELMEGRKQQRSMVKLLASRRAQLEAKLRKQRSLLAQQEARIARLSQPRRRLRLAVSRATYSFDFREGFVFPVAGPSAFSDSFGDPRRGHRHQGNDIFALKGTPVVAVVGGSVNATSTHGGGKTIYLYGDDGNTYIYMHLSGYAETSGHVSQGEVIGYVGNTGNARGGSSHLHFEIRPDGGRAIDPNATLRAAD